MVFWKLVAGEQGLLLGMGCPMHYMWKSPTQNRYAKGWLGPWLVWLGLNLFLHQWFTTSVFRYPKLVMTSGFPSSCKCALSQCQLFGMYDNCSKGNHQNIACWGYMRTEVGNHCTTPLFKTSLVNLSTPNVCGDTSKSLRSDVVSEGYCWCYSIQRHFK